MTRLQKKCLIAAAGTHLLLVVVLLCSGFVTSKPKPDDTQVLDVIPANLIDAALSSGSKNAQPPPPTPIVKPPEPPPAPTPEPPPPVVKPVEPVKQPDPEPVKPPEKLKPEDLTPVDKTPKKPAEHVIKPDLKQIVRKTPPKEADNSAAEAEAKEQKRLRDQRIKAFQSATRSIKENSSSATTVEMPGASSVSYANYASVVKSIYTQAWTPPDDTASDDANVRASVVVGRDGSVVSARVLTPSGDASVDRSVQRTLERVTFIAPFPDGSKEKEKTFIINFNLKAKRMNG